MEEEVKKEQIVQQQPLVMPTLQQTEYAPPTPTATYANDPDYAYFQQRISQAAQGIDPQAQAEQDARIQRGRNFWTGANLLANVVANAINVGGTDKGAPNMTWNDAATQKMYDSWQQRDKELKADREKAQQRYDAMMQQDLAWRMADKKAADAAAMDAYNKNYAAQQAANQARYAAEMEQYKFDRGQQAQLDKEARENETWKERNEITYKQNEKLARIRHSGSRGGSGSKDKNTNNFSVTVGSTDIPAKDKNDALKIQRDVANKIVDRLNRDIEERNKTKGPLDKEPLVKKPKNPNEAASIIYQYGDLYDEDNDLRNDINSNYGIEDIYDEEAESPIVVEETPRAVDSARVPVQTVDTAGLRTAVNPPPATNTKTSSNTTSNTSKTTEKETKTKERRGKNLSGVAYPYGEGMQTGGQPASGYLIGSRERGQNADIPMGSNAVMSKGSQRVSRYKVSGNNVKWNIGGKERAPHELSDVEKELIEKNGEKPKINY